MTATDYVKQFEGFPTFQKIARDAFNAGIENAKTPNVQKLENELKEAKKELKELWDTINDPEKFADFIAGL